MKPVLIIENSNERLTVNESTQNRVVLEGIFTEFDIKNRNERIYTASEFVPHVSEMMDRKNWGVIYGEFDHPDVFDISMKYVSHTIESATFNKEKNRIDGEIRLLSTQWGKEAKAIIEDGCPLFVSSRAAGVTESNGLVKLKKLFTYDIVADPGFTSAKMSIKSLNESFGFSDNTNFKIVEANKDSIGMLTDKYDKASNTKIFDLSDTEKTNELFNMNKKDFVTRKQLADYSNYLTGEISKIETIITSQIKESKSVENKGDIEKLAHYLEEVHKQQSSVIKYLDYLAEKVSVSINKGEKLEEKTNKIVEYSNYLAESLDKSIDYSNYIAEQLDKSIEYSEYVAENLDKSIDYSNYLAESLDKNIAYSEYIAENLDKNIAYSEYIAEALDKNIAYSEYIAEHLDANIGYTEYLAENLDANIGYAEYLAESIDSAINYSEYVAECADKTMSYANMIAEKFNTASGSILTESILTAKEYLISEKNVVPAQTLNESTETSTEETVSEEEEIATPTEEVKEEEETTEVPIEETKKVEIKNENYTEGEITSQINILIEEAKKREASKDKKPAFFAFLTPQDIETFESLTDEDQEKSKVALNESVGYYSNRDVLNIIKQAIEVSKPSNEQVLLEVMPEDIKPIWESLDNSGKKSILAQARYYDLSTDDLKNYFWTTRKFNTSLNESKANLIETSNPFESTERLSEEQINFFTNRFKGI